MINSLGNTEAILILLAGAILLEHIVAWAGSILHSVPSSGESRYAVFTFRDDQDKPMTTNILMNILIPNVAMIFIYMWASYFALEYILENIVFFVIFYFAYIFLLICVLLRRKELFRIGYECSIAGAAIVMAYILNAYYFVNEQNVFIPISELTNELWIAIFLVLYKFFQLILDKWVTQRRVTKESMIVSYITKKFRQYYGRYGHLVEITVGNRYMCILLYALMIFEDYNRGPFLRAVERMKYKVTGKGTLGIMQMNADRMITDGESVELAYEKLQNEIIDEEINPYDEGQINYFAWQYNNDTDYAKSVAFIFSRLFEYLDEIPRYRNEFHLREEVPKAEEENLTDEEADGAENVNSEGAMSEYKKMLTIDDLALMTGLDRKKILKKMRKNGAAILMLEDEAERILKKHMPKG